VVVVAAVLLLRCRIGEGGERGLVMVVVLVVVVACRAMKARSVSSGRGWGQTDCSRSAATSTPLQASQSVARRAGGRKILRVRARVCAFV
jgi:hypothetical protein